MQRNSKIHVSECFYSIQGEGPTAGDPAVFLRLSGCNLLCKSDDWICDTIEVWRKGTATPFDEVFDARSTEVLSTGFASLVITGGEPTLHEKTLLQFIPWVREHLHPGIHIELETNGTREMSPELMVMIDQINCSPKLANSGETLEKRFVPSVLRQYSSHKNCWFKFVICNSEDWEELFWNYVAEGIVDPKQLYLMPGGETQKKLDQTRRIVAGLCKRHLVKYTDRLQVAIWNEATGV